MPSRYLRFGFDDADKIVKKFIVYSGGKRLLRYRKWIRINKRNNFNGSDIFLRIDCK
jgi:hypothetical protein